jgi:hypothetical protein
VVEGWVGREAVRIEIAASSGRWRMNGEERPEVEGSLDLDLNFSPSTNLLPIRRLDLFAAIPQGTGQTYLREILLLADHNAYTLGQVIVFRRLLGIWTQS